MKSLLASVRASGGLDRVDHAVQVLEDEWRKHGDVPLERHWAEQRRLFESEPGGSLVLLAELIKTDLRCRFARGQTPTVAGYLDRFPELEAADSRVLSLIYEEFCLGEERGDRVDVDAFCDRYPRWKDSLVSQLQYHHLFSHAAGVRPQSTPFPEPGETFEEFQLITLLGRGGTSRVFLARDLSLGGKQVVLKVSLDRGREPQAQGALDHPHIVPVNSVVFGDEGMRGLSMPYRPGLPLDEVIRRVDPASKPRWAMALWEAMVRVPESTEGSSPKPESALLAEVQAPGPKGDGWEGFPVRGTYAQGVAWVVKVVAEALHYAHGRKTFHRDVKPANILLTIQQGPQLLDFNLAESPHSASQAQAAMHGGTLPYMAPEQIEAFLNPDLWGKVGAQADIYSLGLVLRELLTGQAPDLPAETLAPARAMRVLLDRRPMLDVSVRRTNPKIPHALEAIVARCLKVSVDERYPDAGALAEDLERFLTRRPLAHAVNPSHRECGWNWGVRNRFRLAVAVVFLTVCLASLAIGMAVERSRTRTRPSIPIESTQELILAVTALDEGRTSDSMDLLEWLAAQYPESSIPKLYLGFAYGELAHPDLLERSVRAVLGMPNGTKELVAWGSNHPQILKRLERFKKEEFDEAAQVEREQKQDEGKRGKTLRDKYQLAKWALETSLGIRREVEQRRSGTGDDVLGKGEGDLPTGITPDPDSSDFDLARAEQELGEYESVIRRANLALPSLVPESPEDERRLYEWRRLRSRALTKLAERQRSAGSKERLRKGLEYLDLAEKDLQACISFVSNRAGKGAVPDRHGLQKIRVAAFMTRVEIDLDLGQLELARTDQERARGALHRYEDLAGLANRTEDLNSWYSRLDRIDRRLREEAAKKAVDNRAVSLRTTRDGPYQDR